MSNYNSKIEQNNTELEGILETIEALPDAGGSCTVVISYDHFAMPLGSTGKFRYIPLIDLVTYHASDGEAAFLITEVDWDNDPGTISATLTVKAKSIVVVKYYGSGINIAASGGITYKKAVSDVDDPSVDDPDGPGAPEHPDDPGAVDTLLTVVFLVESDGSISFTNLN